MAIFNSKLLYSHYLRINHHIITMLHHIITMLHHIITINPTFIIIANIINSTWLVLHRVPKPPNTPPKTRKQLVRNSPRSHIFQALPACQPRCQRPPPGGCRHPRAPHGCGAPGERSCGAVDESPMFFWWTQSLACFGLGRYSFQLRNSVIFRVYMFTRR